MKITEQVIVWYNQVRSLNPSEKMHEADYMQLSDEEIHKMNRETFQFYKGTPGGGYEEDTFTGGEVYTKEGREKIIEAAKKLIEKHKNADSVLYRNIGIRDKLIIDIE